MSTLIFGDLILKMIFQLSTLFLRKAKITQASWVSLFPFPEQTKLLAQQVAFCADDMVAPSEW